MVIIGTKSDNIQPFVFNVMNFISDLFFLTFSLNIITQYKVIQLIKRPNLLQQYFQVYWSGCNIESVYMCVIRPGENTDIHYMLDSVFLFLLSFLIQLIALICLMSLQLGEVFFFFSLQKWPLRIKCSKTVLSMATPKKTVSCRTYGKPWCHKPHS